jgi:hypothetical protein
MQVAQRVRGWAAGLASCVGPAGTVRRLREMGTACSRPQRESREAEEVPLDVARFKYAASKRARASPRSSSLRLTCFAQLASDPDALTAEAVHRLSVDLAQLLLEALIENGSLDDRLLSLFQEVHLWRVRLGRYPGVHTGWLWTLDGDRLAQVDVQGTNVRPWSSSRWAACACPLLKYQILQDPVAGAALCP